MPFQRMKSLVLLAAAALTCSSAFAAPSPSADIRAYEMDSMSVLIASTTMPMSGTLPRLAELPAAPSNAAPDSDTGIAPAAPAKSGLRRMLADFAVTLRDIRYRRGGREPSTGFDCSGFVHYVFQKTLGKSLPSDSASQFLAGAKVDRATMKTGDLVFFRTSGKRISHVGIYLDNGRFIHSQSTGKGVRISHLDEAYWAKRFAGAKRPNVLS